MEKPWNNNGKTKENSMENLSLGEKMLFLGSLDRR